MGGICKEHTDVLTLSTTDPSTIISIPLIPVNPFNFKYFFFIKISCFHEEKSVSCQRSRLRGISQNHKQIEKR